MKKQLFFLTIILFSSSLVEALSISPPPKEVICCSGKGVGMDHLRCHTYPDAIRKACFQEAAACKAMKLSKKYCRGILKKYRSTIKKQKEMLQNWKQKTDKNLR